MKSYIGLYSFLPFLQYQMYMSVSENNNNCSLLGRHKIFVMCQPVCMDVVCLLTLVMCQPVGMDLVCLLRFLSSQHHS